MRAIRLYELGQCEHSGCDVPAADLATANKRLAQTLELGEALIEGAALAISGLGFNQLSEAAYKGRIAYNAALSAWQSHAVGKHERYVQSIQALSESQDAAP